MPKSNEYLTTETLTTHDTVLQLLRYLALRGSIVVDATSRR